MIRRLRSKTLIPFACVLGVLSALPVLARGLDGYHFDEPEYERTTIALTIVFYDDLASLQRALPAGVLKIGRQAKGWSVIRANDNSCVVHIVRLEVAYWPEILGHEVAHCIHGRWHK